MRPSGSSTKCSASVADATPHEGSSPVTAVFGLAVFLGFLLLASQTLVHLYATTVVTAVAFDVASDAASEGRGCQAMGAPPRPVEQQVRERLGALGAHPDVDVSCVDSGDTTSVRVAAPSPARLIGGPLGIGGIERTATVRTERWR